MRLTHEHLRKFDPLPRKLLRDPMQAEDGPHAAPHVWTADALRARYPQGVPVAIWHDATIKAEMYTFQGGAARWSMVNGALGSGLRPGRTWSDESPLVERVLAVHDGLRAVLGDDSPSTKIRDLALFCHGQTSSILYGTRQLRLADLEPTVRAIAGALTPDVRVVLYACNTCRNPSDPFEVADWRRTTLEGGGPNSFAGVLRDWLVRLGKPECEVWGHTTRGHTTYNSALRYFLGKDGVGAAGHSFAASKVHDWRAEAVPRAREAVAAAGFQVRPADEPRFRAAAEDLYARKFYASYQATCGNQALVVDTQRLAMAAPMKPDVCGTILRRRWEDLWQSHRASWGQAIARQARLHA